MVDCGCEKDGQRFCDHNSGNGDGICESCVAMVEELDCTIDDLNKLGMKSCIQYCVATTVPFDYTESDNIYGKINFFI